MSNLNTQIAEFAFPFPAKIFETELERHNIEYRQNKVTSYEGGSDHSIFYVNTKDVEKAIILKARIERENAISEVKHRHPLQKIFAYMSLLLIVAYIIYQYLK